MEHLGSGLSWQEGPENSSLAWSRVPQGRLAWLEREHEGDGRTEEGTGSRWPCRPRLGSSVLF